MYLVSDRPGCHQNKAAVSKFPLLPIVEANFKKNFSSSEPDVGAPRQLTIFSVTLCMRKILTRPIAFDGQLLSVNIIAG